jgi:ATPase subunit of ABC transporter with duplicated ATPase domains
MLLVSHDEAFLGKITGTDWVLERDAAGDTRLSIKAGT